MVTAIVIKLELGHMAKRKEIPTPDGHTHDWMVFVKGADNMVLEHFVEKVVFWLHESYNPPKWVVKSPPYQVRQTGYAGFNLLIDIHFKNKSDPKSVRFDYDMFLNAQSMPPVNHTRVEMLTFKNPAEDFMKRLIKAGGVIKKQDTPGQPKEKKSSHRDKESQLATDSKHDRSSKEKYISEKSRPKTHRSDEKETKPHRSSEQRRNSVGDTERVKKKKTEEKSRSSGSNDSKSKEKEKSLKPKVKLESPSLTASLFSREESINIQQIKKRETSKEDVKPKEKQPEVKVKKEFKVKQEKPMKSKKKSAERKRSPELAKHKHSQEQNPKRHRTVLSSDSEKDLPKKRPLKYSVASDSDSDLDVQKPKKRPTPDGTKPKKLIKKVKKTSKKTEKKISPMHDGGVAVNNTVVTDMDICQTPPSDHSNDHANSGSYKQAAISSPEKKTKSSSRENTRMTSSGLKIHIKDIAKKEASPKPRKEKLKHSYRSTPPTTSRAPSSERKRAPTPQAPSRKEMPKIESSESSDSSDDEPAVLSPEKELLIKNQVSPFSSSSSGSQSPAGDVPQFQQMDNYSDVNGDVLSGSNDQHFDDSDEDNGVFASPVHQEHQGSAFEMHDERLASPQEPALEDEIVSQPLVQVGTGKVNNYPGVTEELYEQLRHLQYLLAETTDITKLRKVLSIVKNSGNYKMDGNLVDFDLCSLDQKTIYKLQKHLVATSR